MVPRLGVWARIVCLLLGLLRGVPAAAEAWQRDPILSQLLVKQMVTDATGFRWVVASEGIFRYDGYDLVPLAQLVRHGHAVPFQHLKAWLLVLDHAGRLWLGTEQGLFCFTPRTGLLEAVPLPAALQATKPDIVALFLHPRSGQLWVASETAVIVLDPNHPARPLGPPRPIGGIPYYFQPDGSAAGVWLSFRQPNWPVRRVYTDALPPGAVQLAPTGPPLRRLTSNCFVVPVPGTEPLQVFSASALFVLKDGQLGEVRRWLPAGNEDNFMLRTTPPDSLHEWVSQGYRIQLTRRGAGVGAVTLDTLQLGHGPADHRHSYVLEQDSLGVQWCYSQFWRGCYKQPVAHRRVVQPMMLANGRPTPSSRAVVRLPDGRLLLGAYGGPLVQAADSPNAPLRPLAVTQHGIGRLPLGYDLLVSRRQEIIFCEDLLGFSQLNPRTGELQALPFAADEPRPPKHCAALLEDHAGRLWGGSSNGLFQLLPQQGRVVRYATGQAARLLVELDILDLAEDSASGALWLATSKGLYLLSPATGALRRIGGHAQAGRPLPTDALLCVASAGAGRAWVGTNAAGLLLVDAGGLVQQIDQVAGMPSHIVATVLGRPDGTVWAGTFAGLVHYDPARQRLAVLTEADGLTDAELNRNSAYADPLTGALWFGGVGGLHRIWPTATEAVSRHAPARLLVTATAVPNPEQESDSTIIVQPLTGGKLPQLQLAAGPAAFVELRLALTNLLLPDLTHYAYRLWRMGEATPSPWLPTTRRLVLRSLPAGDYVVEVRAETVTGQPAANTVRLPLHAARVWWQHPLAWVLGALLLVMLGYLLFWLQGRRARREARLREELAANLHDEVGALLTKISLMAEVLQQQPIATAGLEQEANAATANLTSRLLHSSRDAVQAMRDVVWSIDSRADSVQALLDRMQDHLDQATVDADLEYTFEADQLARLQPLRPIVRKQLYLVFKEAVTNVLRHAQGANTLQVRLMREGEGFVLMVTDDGQNALKPGRSGLGLRNMTARAKVLGGTLETGPRPDGRPGYQVRLWVKG